MSTHIHGVASAQNLDKSSELVDIKGLDITSLARTGTINWEHNQGKDAKGNAIGINLPAQVVGKILKAKKIFGPEDCSDEHEKYFWDKTKFPFVYIVAELLDDYCDSARECAGKFKYSKDHPEQSSILGFSVEGSELPESRKGLVITRSIARKVTLTVAPCNSMCIAEILEDQKPQVKDDFDELFKSEANAIQMFKSDEGAKMYEQFLAKKENFPSLPQNPTALPERTPVNTTQIGSTASGKKMFSHGKTHDYGFNPQEHQEGGEFHAKANLHADNPKLSDNKETRAGLHSQAVKAGGRVENRPARALTTKDRSQQATGKMQLEKSESNKSESPKGIPRGWTPSVSQHKTMGTITSLHHPEHGTVTVHKNPETSNYEVKHSGNIAGIKGKRGIFGSQKEAVGHAQKYVHGLSGGTILGRTTANISSNPSMAKAEKSLKKDGNMAAPPPEPNSANAQAMQNGGTSGSTSFGQAMSNLSSGLGFSKNSKGKQKPLQKALEAGSTNAAPSALAGGAVYQSENLSKPKKKTDWNKRASQDYENWPDKDKFEKFMKARMPHLHEGEIKAIGKCIALSKSMDFEKSLKKLVKK